MLPIKPFTFVGLNFKNTFWTKYFFNPKFPSQFLTIKSMNTANSSKYELKIIFSPQLWKFSEKLLYFVRAIRDFNGFWSLLLYMTSNLHSFGLQGEKIGTECEMLFQKNEKFYCSSEKSFLKSVIKHSDGWDLSSSRNNFLKWIFNLSNFHGNFSIIGKVIEV